MQKYQSIITATNGSVIRNVPVTVLNEDGSLAEIFLDREGQVLASNPLATDSRGVFYFYAKNGRYSLRTSVDGITITDADAVLLNDPQELATAGPIAEAVAAAQAAAQQAQGAVEDSGIPVLVAAAQNAVVDANNAVGQAQAAASLADTAKNESAAAKVAAENAQSGAQSASAQAGQARADAQTAAQAAAQSAASIDPAYLRDRANHTGVQPATTITGLGTAANADSQVSLNDPSVGRLMAVGAFGLGSAYGVSSLPVTGNIDGSEIAATGFYRYTSATIGRPSFSNFGALLNIAATYLAADGNYGTQLAIDYAQDVMAFRRLTGTAIGWGPWRSVYHTGNVGAVGQSLLDASTPAQARLAIDAAFTAVPTTNEGAVIYVTQPHLRVMVWNGTKYVRAPWHRPGVLFFSHAPSANVTNGIQVRADVTYNTADHPDLAEILGVSASTFVLPEGRARVLRASDLGVGIDPSLVRGTLQEDAIQQHTHSLLRNPLVTGVGTAYSGGTFGETGLDSTGAVNTGRSASETRVKSLVADLYITR